MKLPEPDDCFVAPFNTSSMISPKEAMTSYKDDFVSYLPNKLLYHQRLKQILIFCPSYYKYHTSYIFLFRIFIIHVHVYSLKE